MAIPREKLWALLGKLPEAAPLAPEVVERHEEDAFVREKVWYTVEGEDRVPAYLFVPKNVKQPAPTVVCLHQHNGEYQWGKSEPAGLMGNPERAYAVGLARHGFVCIAPDAICFEERQHPELKGANYERFEMFNRLYEGGCLLGKQLFDIGRALDYLRTRPEADMSRLGCIGHSMGAWSTIWAAALYPEIKAAVPNCGTSTYEAFERHLCTRSFYFCAPGLAAYGDVGEVLASIAPRPLLILAGERDAALPVDGCHNAYAVAKLAYDAAGVGDRIRLSVYDVPHEMTPPMRAEAYAWLERWL